MPPNFLIVGAAKSGTTALYLYLKQHPEIYMSSIKEPRFLTSQFLKFPHKGPGDTKIDKMVVRDFDKYRELFTGSDQKKAVGECSVDNLYYYNSAISSINRYLNIDKIKIIIILRNPVERAYSAYLHLIRANREFLSFEDALEKEYERKNENWRLLWLYKDVGFYYKQVEAYLKNFSQIKVYIYDDLKRDTLGLIKDINGFLEVDTSFIPDISVKPNISGVPKNKFIHNFITKEMFFKKIIKLIVGPFFPREKQRKLRANLIAKNLGKPIMKPETQKSLKKLYQKDILKLQGLIRKDLSHWL